MELTNESEFDPYLETKAVLRILMKPKGVVGSCGVAVSLIFSFLQKPF